MSNVCVPPALRKDSSKYFIFDEIPLSLPLLGIEDPDDGVSYNSRHPGPGREWKIGSEQRLLPPLPVPAGAAAAKF